MPEPRSCGEKEASVEWSSKEELKKAGETEEKRLLWSGISVIECVSTQSISLKIKRNEVAENKSLLEETCLDHY